MSHPTTLRERRKEELREEILAAARTLFVQIGYDAFSMRKLAEKVGCSAGNLYLYFPSREELFRCLMDESFAELKQQLVESCEPGPGPVDPVARLKRGMRAYVDFGVSHPDAYGIAFLVRRPQQRDTIKPHAAFSFLQTVVASCVAAKRFRAVDVDLVSQSLWVAIHGLTSLLIHLPQFPWVARDQLMATVIDNAVDPFTRPRKGRS
jgi:AcrR family transcriptional regulator